MSDSLSRRHFLALAGAASALDRTRLTERMRATLHRNEGIHPSPVVVRGNARFQILSPTVIRLEYSPTGHFIDALSVSVLNRSWPPCPFTARDANGWVEITTSRMQVRYQLGSGPFTDKNLLVNWTDADGARAWKPGDVDDKNLGGVGGDWCYRVAPASVAEEPGALSRNGYFWLDDSTTAIWNSVTQWPEPRPEATGRQDWYIFVYGREFPRLFRELTQLLGPIPMVPRYVLGTWFGSRAGYSSDEWQRIVHRFREERIPLDMVVLDSDTAAAVVWAGYDFDREQMPDPKGFFTWMKGQGVHVTVNEHYSPITPQSDHHFEQVRLALGLPVGTTEIGFDIADKKAAQVWMDVLHKPALDAGLAFWWQDGNAGTTMPGLDGTLWTRHVEYEGQERLTGKRTFIFCRLGPVLSYSTPAWGVHRYGSFFTGDLLPYWEVLELLIPLNVRSGNMLVPYTNNLTLGVHQETVEIELYQRWVQFGAFSPLFWWHGKWGLRLPWEYGEVGMAAVKQFLSLRYRLLPYYYTYTRLAHETGLPPLRGTYVNYPQQEQAYTFDHQYLFGDAFLVAPITRPGAGQPVDKDVYLPSDAHWFDYFTGEIYPGGQVLPYTCPLNRMPLFVKAGSIIPMAPEMDFTDQRPLDLLVLDIYAGPPTTFRLYEDDGTSLDYRTNAYAWTPIRYTPTETAGEHIITIGATTGQYHGQPQARRYRLQVHGLCRPAQVRVQGQRLLEQTGEDLTEGWVWHTASQVLELKLSTPIHIRDTVTVTLTQAGTLAEVVALQQVRTYRERVRRVQLTAKLRWALLLDNREINKEPHVLQVIEQVEQQLNDVLDRPARVGMRPPDLRLMTAAILAAGETQPFDSRRAIPDADTGHHDTYLDLAKQTMTPRELHQMTADLLGCRLVTSTTIGGTDIVAGGPTMFVTARVVYDIAVMGTAPTVTYELTLPQSGLPGWDDMSQTLQADGTTHFGIRAPFPLQAGTYLITVQATVTWGAAQTVVTSTVPWVVLPTPPGWVPPAR